MYNTVANLPDNPDGGKEKKKKTKRRAAHLHSKLDYSSGGSERTHT